MTSEFIRGIAVATLVPLALACFQMAWRLARLSPRERREFEERRQRRMENRRMMRYCRIFQRQEDHGESPAQSSFAADGWQLGSPQGAEARRELRVRARLAWNNWPDNEASRKAITEHEAKDSISAAAWDRVIDALAYD